MKRLLTVCAFANNCKHEQLQEIEQIFRYNICIHIGFSLMMNRHLLFTFLTQVGLCYPALTFKLFIFIMDYPSLPVLCKKWI